MNLAVVGTGYVGAVTGAVFADWGNRVTCLDIDEEKISLLRQGRLPFFEPGLAALVKKNLENGRLRFTTDYAAAVPEAEIIFICVGTPTRESGETDLSFLLGVARSLAPLLAEGTVVAIKSTVPPEANRLVRETIASLTPTNFFLASCPEFLSEGTAVANTRHPDRVVIGADDPAAIEKLLRLHEPAGGERIVCRPQSAQLIKYAANIFLAMKISYANALAEICERYQASIDEVAEGIGADPRIGKRFLRPGIGFGGSCLPKDLKSMISWSGSEATRSLLRSVQVINRRQTERTLAKAARLAGSLKNKTAAVLGLSFKPETDDLRESPAVKLVERLLALGAAVRAYDPAAMPKIKPRLRGVVYCESVYQAAQGADVLILATEWEEFADLDWPRLKRAMKAANVVDGRNFWRRETLEKAGFNYEGFGR
jgi:UDPglucose 6-dehydrogenase